MQLQCDGLTIERGGRRIIEGLSFRVAAGEALLLTGPNGAGKTTLLRAIAGYLAPSAGTVALAGGDPDREIAEHCHFIGHRDGVKTALTVAENAQFWSRFLSGRGAVDAALETLGIADLAAVPAAYLSAGQRRRLGLSRLLLAERPLWLLDEPTVSLDASGVAALATMVGSHLTAGGLVLAATHIPLGLEGARELRLGAAVTSAAQA